MPKAHDTQRLFFALWPEAGLAAHIDHTVAPLLTPCRGRKLPPHNFHITLAFLGSLDAGGRRCVEAAAARVQAEPFAVSLEKLGYWPRQGIVWLAPAEMTRGLESLQTALVHTLARDCGCPPASRSFRPHLSLMRKARRRPAQTTIAPLVWRVDRFVLVRAYTHSTGVEYELLNHWPLRD